MIAIALVVHKVEPVRLTRHGIPVRTVRCTRKDGLNHSRTSFFDVWLWRELATRLRLNPGDAIVVSGKLVGVDTYLAGDGQPRASVIISATGCSVVSDAGQGAPR